jgi:hypothetical protein
LIRIVFIVVVGIHGLIHLMGFAKAFGYAALPRLAQPIPRTRGRHRRRGHAVAPLVVGAGSGRADRIPVRHRVVVERREVRYRRQRGDLHNLFGNPNTVHVSLANGGGYQIEHVVTGDTVTDVLKYDSYPREDLVARVRRFAELAVRANRMSLEETRSMLRMYEEGLAGYTYLERS